MYTAFYGDGELFISWTSSNIFRNRKNSFPCFANYWNRSSFVINVENLMT